MESLESLSTKVAEAGERHRNLARNPDARFSDVEKAWLEFRKAMEAYDAMKKKNA